MIIDIKSKEIGINDDLVLYLLNKTKHKGALVKSVTLFSVTNLGDYCIKLNLQDHFRKEITLHISQKKLIKLRRETIIDSILEK